MKKRIFAVLALVIAMVMIVTACGGKKTVDETTEKTETVENAESEIKNEETTPVESENTASKPSSDRVVGVYLDAADDYYKAGFEVFKPLAEAEGWKVVDVVGQGTAPEQIDAVENFITQQVDAIVMYQNSPQASSECLKKTKEAGIPVFFLTHTPPDDEGLAGFAGYDFVHSGSIAAESAIKNGVKRIIMIEGKLGQGTASGQTEGFVTGYKNAGLDVGDAMNIGGKGGEDLQIVFWGSGGWFADPAKQAMQDAITTLGPDGFDGAYVQNDEMMDGALQAMEEAGLNPGDYWLGSSNGKEKSWKWVEEGKVTMDVNQTPSLEADLVFQMVKANFAGEEYKKCVYSSMIPYEKGAVDASKLIPYESKAYFEKKEAGAFVYDLKDDVFKLNPNYSK